MGCGASKAAKVLEEEINILDHPARRSCEDHETETGVLRRGKEGKGEAGEGLDPVYSDQSEIERAVKNATSPSSSTTTPSFSSAVAGSSPPSATQTVPPSVSAPLVFEVCMSPDDRLEARVPIPARLKKLESAPMVTKEMLEMKQHLVAERKKEEIEKRLERSRMSKKDRLRKEIMAARELNPSESEKEVVLTESLGYSRLREEEGGGGGRSERREEGKRGERGSYNTSALMEGDTKYNKEQEGGELGFLR
ncbi:hypothetical protein GBAR_LOCUS14861 [Geodia barretti]|uniref:Uncharacterized protein n=1 Tax=Geodia barretti TaxID=519541 RepID=A0AA35S9R3_GEOBA|nr:hypothetical protein GBAR_LOCUS14861 [Geodia barretti]